MPLLHEIYKYRYVIFSYVQIHLRLRYRRSALGFIWTVLAPLMQYLIIGVVFKYAAKIQSDEYYVYFFTGSIVFNVFSVLLARAPLIMTGNEHFIKKIHLPKVIYVLNAVAYEFVNFLIVFLTLFTFGTILGFIKISWALFLIPLAMLLVFLCLSGMAALLSVVGVYFRDMNYIVPPLLQACFFITPIAYEIHVLPQIMQNFLFLNPFYHYIEIFRVILLKGQVPGVGHIGYATVFALIFFSLGVWVIKKFDNKIVFKL